MPNSALTYKGPEYAAHHQSAGLRRLAARCRPLHQRVAKSRRNGSRRSSSWSKLDPGFAAAWALLSQCYSSQYFQGYVVTDARRQGPKRHSITLCNWPPTRRRHSARAALRILDSTRLCRRDWHLHGLELAFTQQRRTRSPCWALSARRQGDFAEAIRRLDQAVNLQLLTETAWTHGQTRDFESELRIENHALQIKANDPNANPSVCNLRRASMMRRHSCQVSGSKGTSPMPSLPWRSRRASPAAMRRA